MDMENKENAEEPERRTELTVQGELLVVGVTCNEDLGSYLVSVGSSVILHVIRSD
jgi:hypothetical protein